MFRITRHVPLYLEKSFQDIEDRERESAKRIFIDLYPIYTSRFTSHLHLYFNSNFEISQERLLA